jgi:cellulose synthase/poly-beta-1,6-N-acetylglucosamine synthase-like glycosyltransferase
MNSNSFTIGIPVIKSDFLEKTVESCLKQEYTNFDIIILVNTNDNVIKQNVIKIIELFHSPKIRYFENDKQLPLVENWNKLLQLVEGDYFTLLSDDDFIEDSFLNEFNSLINKYPDINVFHCRLREVDGENNLIGISPTCPEFENIVNYIWHRIFYYRKQYISDFVFNAKKLKELGGFYNIHEVGWGTDDITTMMLSKDKGIAYCVKILLNYRIHNANMTKIGNIIDKFEATQIHKKWLIKFLDDLLNIGSITYSDKEIILLIKKNINGYFEKKKLGLLYLYKDSICPTLLNIYRIKKIYNIENISIIKYLIKRFNNKL